MKILITGAYGQLGNEIKEMAPKYNNWVFLFTDADTLNIADEKAVQQYISENKPDFIINCAAYTAVDKAESEEETAQLLNAVAPGFLAKAAKKQGAGFIHISTDYVFNGRNFMPYTENVEVSPETVYGKTKLEGEKICLAENPESLIIRTSWLYSSFGNNFLKTMVRLGKERGEVNVIYDQVGTPTYAADLAQAVLEIIQKSEQDGWGIKPGIFHYSNEGAISWYDFAKAIFEVSEIDCKVGAIPSSAYKQIALRPHFSVLDKSKIKNTFQLEIPYWKDSLKNCIKKLNL